MRPSFADTLYWVALLHRNDQWHQAAVQASRRLAGCTVVMTDEILSEVLTAFCEAGPLLRQRAATLVRRLYHRPAVTVHPQSRAALPTLGVVVEVLLAGLVEVVDDIIAAREVGEEPVQARAAA
jgi:hypothetical protein